MRSAEAVAGAILKNIKTLSKRQKMYHFTPAKGRGSIAAK
jgi:hypothetical protein